jgi:hypothetical protein
MDKSNLKNGIISHPGITINDSGRWYHNKIEIININILNYFKKNIYRIDSDYYIHNQFGEKNEFAMLDSVQGFPVQITQILSFQKRLYLIHLDYGDEITIPDENFLYFNDSTLAALLPEKNVLARLNGYAMTSLMKDLDEDKSGRITLGKDHYVIQIGRLEDYFV